MELNFHASVGVRNPDWSQEIERDGKTKATGFGSGYQCCNNILISHPSFWRTAFSIPASRFFRVYSLRRLLCFSIKRLLSRSALGPFSAVLLSSFGSSGNARPAWMDFLDRLIVVARMESSERSEQWFGWGCWVARSAVEISRGDGN